MNVGHRVSQLQPRAVVQLGADADCACVGVSLEFNPHPEPRRYQTLVLQGSGNVVTRCRRRRCPNAPLVDEDMHGLRGLSDRQVGRPPQHYPAPIRSDELVVVRRESARADSLCPRRARSTPGAPPQRRQPRQRKPNPSDPPAPSGTLESIPPRRVYGVTAPWVSLCVLGRQPRPR
jgi:hypothetical protein